MLKAKRGLLALLTVCVLALVSPASAHADCTDARVKRLADQGETLTAIARECDMSKDEIRDILDAEAERDDEDRDGLPSETPIGDCGCWGYVDPSYRQPHPQCESGYAKPSICPGLCPAGGYPWRGVCT